jgi:hypothetical protein
MRNPWEREHAVCREIEREHGEDVNRGDGILVGAVLGAIVWELIFTFVL